jgi:hypothetical protein
MGWYGAPRSVDNASELAGWNNAYISSEPQLLVQTRLRYGFTQQLLALEDTFLMQTPNGGPGGKPGIVLIPGWRQTLQNLAPLYGEMLRNGTIVGFFLGDELMWNGFAYRDLVQWSNELRKMFPSAFLWENEAYPSYSCDPAKPLPTKCVAYGPCCSIYGEPTLPLLGIPPALNATSVDIYAWTPKANKDLVHGRIKSYYAAYLKPRLHPTQTLFVVPGADSSTHNSECDLACYDAECARNAFEFLAWMQSDATIGGCIPWTWRSCGAGCVAPEDERGASTMNKTKAAWREVGRIIMNMSY